MDKFTIFTVILAVSVITVTADLAIRDYTKGQANVLEDSLSPIVADTEPLRPPPSRQPSTPPPPPPPAPLPLPEEPVFIPTFVSKLTQKNVQDAGFKNALSRASFNGKVFQLLDITQIAVDDINFYQVQEEDSIAIASITEIVLRDEIRALQMYSLLQNKTKPYIDLSLNETNAYGERSFYINHIKKPDEAFLTVKIGRVIYAFAYVKTYHPLLKKLLALLSS